MIELIKTENGQVILKQDSDEAQIKGLKMLYHYGLFDELWQAANEIKSRRVWTAIAETALELLDLSSAARIYQQILSDANVAITIDRIRKIEDRNEVLGHIAVIFKDFDLAQVFYHLFG
jgi:WD repeat-containing protein 19